MTHKRAQIREAYRALLAPLPTTAGRVYVAAVYPLPVASSPETLPAINLHTPEDELEDSVQGMSPRLQGRNLTVAVDVHTAGANMLDVLDQVALEVEQAVMADPQLGGLAEWTELQSASVEPTGELEDSAAQMTIEFLTRYRVDATDPQ